MARELMGYKFKGSGHEVPEEKRKFDQNGGLARVFLAYLDSFGKTKLEPSVLIKDLEASVEEMHSILPAFQDHKRFCEATGLFISAVYNKVPDTQIVFDVKLDVRLSEIGIKLAKNKTLINRATVNDIGAHSEGTIINEGDVEYVGFGNAGNIINLGTAGHLGIYASGKVINYGKADRIGAEPQPKDNLITTAQLINYGSARKIGEGAGSLVINLGIAGHRMSCMASPDSTIINYGKAGRDFGSRSEGIVLAYEKPESFGMKSRAKLAWNQEDCEAAPKLWKYLKALKEKLETGRTDYKKALAVLEEMNIQKDIAKIIRKEGYEI